MVFFTEATAATKHWQWETSSLFSQSNNCGPTCITFIGGFYTDSPNIGVEATRGLIANMGPYNVNGQIVMGAPQDTPTQPWQQRDMLIKRGVFANVRQLDTLDQLHDLVDSGRRPTLIGLFMGLVPQAYRDHPFQGWHAVVVLDGGWRSGQRGFWILDPNFSPPGGHRPDPDRGRKWWPDWVVQNAYINNSPRWSVVPENPKQVLAAQYRGRGHVEVAGANIRTSMSLKLSTNIYARTKAEYTYRIRDGERLWANSHRYIFLGFDASKQWAKVMLANGRRLFIHRNVFEVDRWP